MHPNRGITLIEIIITIFVVSLGLVAVLNMFPLGNFLVSSGKMSTIAELLARGKIEEELSQSYNEVLVGTATENYGNIANFSNFKRVKAVSCVRPSDLLAVDCGYDSLNDPYPMKKIEVTVYWHSPLGIAEKNINLVSLISKR